VSPERLTQSAPDCWAEANGMVCAKAHAERSEMAGLNFINLMIDSGRVNSGRVNRMGENLEGEVNLLGSLCSFEYTQMLRLGYHPKRGYFAAIFYFIVGVGFCAFFAWAPESFTNQREHSFLIWYYWNYKTNRAP